MSEGDQVEVTNTDPSAESVSPPSTLAMQQRHYRTLEELRPTEPKFLEEW
jgi:hypothetical protein